MTQPIKGRGALSNPEGRFAASVREYDEADTHADSRVTELRPETARRIISRNSSPDVPFEQSINPYRGCEHGCVYCYARPSHAYLDLSPGLDFETRLTWKSNAAEALERELRHPAYRCRPITLGANTDPYQPVERRLGVTRSLLEVMRRFGQPVTIITKSALVTRDLDILGALASEGLVRVVISLTTLDPELKRTLEPRAASPRARLRALAELRGAGIPAGVLTAPVIPAVNDHEIEAMLAAAAAAGADSAGYVLLRLPWEVKGLFREWLETHMPLRAEHVMSLVRQMRDGRENDPRFGSRMRGRGQFADLLAARFGNACRRHGLGKGRSEAGLRTDRFRVPPAAGDQLSLLDES
ncbi:MAG: PA0069 family radical SAM protein [Gammaproteobacteria bacterium]|jgi:DNA repair photolyase